MDFNMQRDKMTSSCEINLTETEPKRDLKPTLNPKPILLGLPKLKTYPNVTN